MNLLAVHRTRTTIGLLFLTAAMGSVGLKSWLHAETPAAAISSTANPRDALIVVFRTNLDYCRPWIAAKDFKSLTKNVAALSVLTDAMSRQTAESGREKNDALRTAVAELAAAAKAEDAQRAAKAHDAIPAALDATAHYSVAETPKAAGKTAAGFNSLMFTIDGTFSDAKAALEFDEPAAAKTNIVVLAELAQWLAADRNDARWREMAGDFRVAAEAAVAAESNDSKSLRTALRNIYTRCEACHHRQR